MDILLTIIISGYQFGITKSDTRAQISQYRRTDRSHNEQTEHQNHAHLGIALSTIKNTPCRTVEHTKH